MATMWLDAISVPFFILRSTITASQRDQAKDTFQDRVANCNVLVLPMLSLPSGSASERLRSSSSSGMVKVQPQKPGTELSQEVAQSLVRKGASDLGFTVAPLARGLPVDLHVGHRHQHAGCDLSWISSARLAARCCRTRAFCRCCSGFNCACSCVSFLS
ncbi:uncharacterized protein BDW70DRAFT_163637 [Aspergillus foveolatus]|uniref:uncharacterized protein n=1 Tax=Aspergillus foveolatus TaxID=210207 RepID=UPI003CCDF6F6